MGILGSNKGCSPWGRSTFFGVKESCKENVGASDGPHTPDGVAGRWVRFLPQVSNTPYRVLVAFCGKSLLLQSLHWLVPCDGYFVYAVVSAAIPRRVGSVCHRGVAKSYRQRRGRTKRSDTGAERMSARSHEAPLRSNLKLFRKRCLHPKNAALVRRHFCCSVICRSRRRPSEGGLPLRGWCRPWRWRLRSGRCRPFGFRGWRGCRPPKGWWAFPRIASGP